MESCQLLIVAFDEIHPIAIAKILLGFKFQARILSPEQAVKWLENNQPKGIILSGGGAVTQDSIPEALWKSIADVPVLSIGVPLRGDVGTGESRDTSCAKYRINLKEDPLFQGMSLRGATVWKYSGHNVMAIPEGFRSIAETENSSTCVGIADDGRHWMLWFYPESPETDNGKDVFRNFSSLCACVPDWYPDTVVRTMRQAFGPYGESKSAVIGFNGKSVYTTLAALLEPVFGERLQAVCVDTGWLPKSELKRIRSMAKRIGVNLRIVGAVDSFQKVIRQKSSPEDRLRLLARTYDRCMLSAARRFGASYIVRGTLMTDRPDPGSVVRLLDGPIGRVRVGHPEIFEFRPFRNMLPHEVFSLAASLGVTDPIFRQKPFPWPGPGLRIIGGEVTSGQIALLRRADHAVTEMVSEHDPGVSRLIVELWCASERPDRKQAEGSVVVWAQQPDGLTQGSAYSIPENLRRQIVGSVMRIPGVRSVLFDESDRLGRHP